MEIKSDIEIAQSCEMKNIREIAATAGVDEKYLEMYGNYKAKVDYKLLNETAGSGRQADPGHRHHPHPCGRGQDHHLRRAGGRPAEAGQEVRGRPA